MIRTLVALCLIGTSAAAQELSDDMTFAMNYCAGPIVFGIDAETEALEDTTAEALERTPEPSAVMSDPVFHLGPQGQMLSEMQAGEQRFCQISQSERSLDVDRSMIFAAADIFKLALSGSCALRADAEPMFIALASWDKNARGYYTTLTFSENPETARLSMIAAEWPTSRLDRGCR